MVLIKHTRKRNLSAPYEVSALQYWTDNPNIDYSYIKKLYNPLKKRTETWQRAKLTQEFVLWEALPSRFISEDFIGPTQFVPAILGLTLENAWSTNGNPAPVAGNFTSLNEIGGGLGLNCLGVTVDDFIAMHTGGNYPVTIGKSPHTKLTIHCEDITERFALFGLVGSSGLQTADDAAWTQPDDGIWIEYDTNVDNQLHFVTSVAGVRTQTPLGAPPGVHVSFRTVVNDNHNEVLCLKRGIIVARHNTNLPAVDTQLKPLFMTGTRVAAGGVAKQLHLHDFRLIFDRGINPT